MNLRALRYFVTLAREGHFARAADLCGITQPTLSDALAALEEELGKRLVERDRRFVGLTAHGKALLPWAQQIVAAQDGLLQSLGGGEGGLQGTMRLGVIPAAMALIGPLCRTLTDMHPHITLSITSLSAGEIASGLAAFELDAGISYAGSQAQAGAISVELRQERFVFASASSANIRPRAAMNWREAATYPLCLLDQGMQNRRIIDACFAWHKVTVAPRVTADTFVALMAMIETGSFATIIPECHMELLRGLEWAHFMPMERRPASGKVVLVVSDRKPVSDMANAALVAARRVSGQAA